VILSPTLLILRALFAGWRCAYPAYKTRRPVQAKRRRANQAAMRPDALTPALSHREREQTLKNDNRVVVFAFTSISLIFHPEKGTFSP